MHEPDLARKLSLLATDVDSLTKALVQAQAERASEQTHRQRADARAEELSQQLRQARRRAKAAERELATLSASTDAIEHRAQTTERELRERLEQEEQAKTVLRHDVERIERERRALALNLREVLGNLRSAAQEARQSRVADRAGADDVTLMPSGTPDTGW
jgi:chromosome segregation ATPase